MKQHSAIQFNTKRNIVYLPLQSDSNRELQFFKIQGFTQFSENIKVDTHKFQLCIKETQEIIHKQSKGVDFQGKSMPRMNQYYFDNWYVIRRPTTNDCNSYFYSINDEIPILETLNAINGLSILSVITVSRFTFTVYDHFMTAISTRQFPIIKQEPVISIQRKM